MTGTEMWKELRSVLDSRLGGGNLLLETAYENANQTFEGRLSKIRSKTLVDMLKRAQTEMNTNYTASRSQIAFCYRKLEEHESLLLESVGEVRVHTGDGGVTSFEEAMAKVGDLAELDYSARIIVATSKFAFEALVLCSLLAGLLGHKEAIAFEEGAKKELLGAIGDPGPGIITLLKRFYAVSTRTLRADQDADELLESLDSFVRSMSQWRELCVKMSEEVPLGQAIGEVYGDATA